MPTDPAAVLHRLTERLAPLERSLHLAYWAAATDARPETSAARQRAEEALLEVLADPELFAEVEAAVAEPGNGDPLTRRALAKARLDLLAGQIPADARADLEPRPGKDQHAFCLDIDRAGDIRVLANIAPGEESLDTMLHEVGHAVYDDHVDRSPGASLTWRDLVVHATGRPLGREAFLVGLG